MSENQSHIVLCKATLKLGEGRAALGGNQTAAIQRAEKEHCVKRREQNEQMDNYISVLLLPHWPTSRIGGVFFDQCFLNKLCCCCGSSNAIWQG